MIWYALAALASFFYYRKKYNMPFWVGFWHAFLIGSGIYLAIVAVSSFITLATGIEESSPAFFIGLLFAALSFGCFWLGKVPQTVKDEPYYVVHSKKTSDPLTTSSFRNGPSKLAPEVNVPVPKKENMELVPNLHSSRKSDNSTIFNNHNFDEVNVKSYSNSSDKTEISYFENTNEGGVSKIEVETVGINKLNQNKKRIDISFDPDAANDVPKEEIDALVTLYFTTQGNRWKNSTNWLTSESIAHWEGVKVQNGHVIGLSLSSNGLKGFIPPEIGNLNKLNFLLLNENELLGSIPAELGSLLNLEYLYLYNNQLTGNLPTQLGKLINLKELDIGSNDFSGYLPITFTFLNHLEYLNYEGTNLEEPNISRFQIWKNSVESWEG